MDPVSFVRALELPPSCLSRKLPAVKDQEIQAFVDSGSLVSFPEELAEQNKSDVLNSTLLAQLAATEKYDRFTDAKTWYEFYFKVLQEVGWDFQDFHFTEYNSAQSSFTVSKIVIQFLRSLVGQKEPVLVDALKKSLDALQKSPSLALFFTNSSNKHNSNFQVILCTQGKKNKQVKVDFVAAYFSASKVEEDFLYFDYRSSAIKLMITTNVLTLNEDVYSQVREKVIEKLGNAPQNLIKELDIS